VLREGNKLYYSKEEILNIFSGNNDVVQYILEDNKRIYKVNIGDNIIKKVKHMFYEYQYQKTFMSAYIN
jgi:hypothetical protein